MHVLYVNTYVHTVNTYSNTVHTYSAHMHVMIGVPLNRRLVSKLAPPYGDDIQGHF